jgi:hypothetical protein
VRRRVAFVVVLVFASSLVRGAVADEYVPSKPTFRPALGWVCWPRRTVGDFAGDGHLEPAVVFDRSGPHRSCDELHPELRWHVAVLLGRGSRILRPLPCETPAFCRPAAGDLDGDGRAELAIETCCGAIVSEWHVYRLEGSRLPTPTVLPGTAAALDPGPLVLSYVSDAATHDGFGCRTHPDGSRILLVWTGRLGRPGHWRFERTRLRSRDGTFRAIGVRRRRMEPRVGNRLPRGPRVEPCFVSA